MASKEGTFGHHVSPDLIKQIEVREKIIGKGAFGAAGGAISGFSNSFKTDHEMTFLYSNTPWVILRSSVNIGSDGGDSARVFGLSGGQIAFTGVNGIERGRAGLSGWGELGYKPAYKQDSVFGFRPMPGITGVKVKTKDTWGTIMEADVSIVIWSRDDLEIIDKLYFRPGMTALLEWGHSSYFKNDGSSAKATSSTIVPNEIFFKEGSMEDIENKLSECRKNGEGNYEGIFGYITNFSWTFNDNGSYSASVKILSKGSILDGLQIRTQMDESDGTEETGNGRSTSMSIFHRAFGSWNSAVNQDSRNIGVFSGNYSLPYNDEPNFYNVSFVKAVTKVKWFGRVDEENIIWVYLGDLLKLIEIEGGLVDDQGKRCLRFDDTAGYRYLSFDEHFSLNPYVAYMQHNARIWKAEGNEYVYPPTTITSDSGVGSRKYDFISLIKVSLNFVLDTVESIIDGETKTFSIKTLIETVLAEIQKAFGNVNDFALHFNHEDGTFAVVDHNCPSDIGEIDTEPGKIRISGVGTTVKKLKINSEVSADIAKEVSIAAAGGGGTGAHPSLIHWNDGLENRHYLPHRDITTNVSGRTNESQPVMTDDPIPIKYDLKTYNAFYAKVVKFYEIFLGKRPNKEDNGKSVNELSGELYSEIQVVGQDIFKLFVEHYYNIRQNPDNSDGGGYLQTGVIPIKVEMTMLGIGRFIVGTSFMVHGQGGKSVVPPQYENWGWIITGVEHEINSSGWTTSLRTQYFPVIKTGKSEQPSETQQDTPSTAETMDKTKEQTN